MKLFKIIVTFFICLPILFALISCKQNNKQNIVEQKQSDDSVKIQKGIDTSIYKLHKSGFYVSKNGDVYQRNGATIDDSAGIWTDYDWLDSTMFYENNETKKSLKSIIDIETFTSDSISRFEKDKNHVYYAWGTTDGVRRFIVDDADAKTFKSLGNSQSYGKDKFHVFYSMEIIKEADLKSFHVIERDTARDKKHLYVKGEIVEE
jgi:DKNYY family